eukprot:Nk52_evm11s2474 gene=Nk52_evmTU11s2474
MILFDTLHCIVIFSFFVGLHSLVPVTAVNTASLTFSSIPSGDLDDSATYGITVQGSNGADETVNLLIESTTGGTGSWVIATDSNSTALDGNSPSAASFTGIKLTNGDFKVTATAATSGVKVETSTDLKVYHKTLKIGVLVERNMFGGFGDNAEISAHFAAEMINANSTLLPKTTISNTGGNSACNKATAVKNALDLQSTQSIDVLMGPGCSTSSEVVVPTMLAFEINVVSYGSSSEVFSNKQVFPNFLRTWPSASDEQSSLTAICQHFNFTHVASITVDTFPFSSVFHSQMTNRGITQEFKFVFSSGTTDFTKELTQIKDSGVRVIVIISFGTDGELILKQAIDVGIAGPGYTWILGSASYDSALLTMNQTYNSTHETQDFYVGSLTTTATYTGGDSVLADALVAKWNAGNVPAAFAKNPSAGSTAEWTQAGGPAKSLASTGNTGFDAIYTFAYASHALIESRKAFTGPALLGHLFNTSFVGVGGVVAFDKNGDRRASRLAMQIRRDKATFTRSSRAVADFYTFQFMSLEKEATGSFTTTSIKTTGTDSKGWTGMMWSDKNASTALSQPPSFTCQRHCGNGVCSSPNLCKCNDGWENAASITRLSDCTKAICTNCTNGECIYPQALALVNIGANNGLPTVFCSCDSGWTGSTCAESESETSLALIIGSTAAGAVLLIICILIFISYRRYVTAKSDLSWLLDRSEIRWISNNDCAGSRFSGLGSEASDKSSIKDIKENSCRRLSVSMASGTMGQSQPTNVASANVGVSLASLQSGVKGKTMLLAQCRGSLYYPKRIGSSFTVNKDVSINFHHYNLLTKTNIANVLGVILPEASPENATEEEQTSKDYIVKVNAYMLIDYHSRGSLMDFVLSSDQQMDTMFIFSVLNDIANGLRTIHASSRFGFHGLLTLEHCLIDSRWTVKLSNFGFHDMFAERDADRENNETHTFSQLQWVAPELIDPETLLRQEGSRPGDIFSLGVIISCLLNSDAPYHDIYDLSTEDIIREVLKGNMRPHFEDGCEFPRGFDTLLDGCVAFSPHDRYSLKQVINKLSSLNPDKNMSVIDTMMKRLEVYAQGLEEIVMQRTSELQSEKQKSDRLLYSLIPQAVAEKLKTGEKVEAEEFSCVTVYFSDIVGFTTIASSCTPMQVVSLLNDLYTGFDAQISQFNVYKVETIGDAYMVVSGLPQRCDDHCSQICQMSLHLLSFISTFTSASIPGKKVQLRIGVHSGPVVAGVVGLTMPRYCLFGDTVNTASRMESSGMALRIQCSPTAKAQMDKTKDKKFKIESRGIISVKGKADMETFWLQGMEGFDKPLPNLKDAASLSEHEFK